jgi:hypothetical protein
MSLVRLIVLVLALSACAPSGANSSLAPGPSIAPSDVAASATPAVAASATPAVTAPATPSVSGSPEPSGACIDRGRLADTADSANNALQGMAAAIKANKIDEARGLAGTAASQMRSLANLVEAARPLAATALRNAADKLDSAMANLADATAVAPVVETLFNQAYDLANAGACPA